MSWWCRHLKQTTPRRDERGEYRRCLECGARTAWAWPDKLTLRPPRRAQPSPWEAFCHSLGIEEKIEVHRS
ncbi:MAG: hypothetical protein HY647_13685 [Acidobacteria bacterium]|nr:hypothetical protein [Acidobacteriota bacterium]